MTTPRKITAILLVCALVFITPLHAAHAFGIDAFLIPFTVISYLIKAVIAITFNLFSNLVEILLEVLSYIPLQIEIIWGIIRDVLNLVFILLLIVMAFGTIFEVKEYTYKEMFGPFLVSAILINFSFAISNYLIQLSNGITHVFFNTIREAVGGDIVNIFKVGFARDSVAAAASGSPSGIIAAAKAGVDSVVQVAKDVGNTLLHPYMTLLNNIFAIIFLLIGTFVLATISVFMLFRQPALWLLLIMAPAAWVARALPGHFNSFWKKWWTWFMGWTFFIPIYAFFLMIMAIIMKAREDVAGVGFAQIYRERLAQGRIGAALRESLLHVIGLNDIVFFIITLAIGLIGLYAAWRISSGLGGFAGTIGKNIVNGKWAVRLATGVLTGGGAAAQGVFSYAGNRLARGAAAGTARAAWGRRLSGLSAGFGWATTALRNQPLKTGGAFAAAGKTAASEFVRRTLLDKHGDEKAESEGTEIGYRLAGGRRLEAEEERKKRIEHEYDRYRRLNATGQPDEHGRTWNEATTLRELRHALDSGDVAEAAALAKLAGEKGWLRDATTIQRTLDSVGGTNTQIGKDLWAVLKKNVDRPTADALYSAAIATGNVDDEVSIAFLRGEKGWVPEDIPATGTTPANPVGTNEVFRVLDTLGADSAGGKDYLEIIDKNDFQGIFRNPADKIRAARNFSAPGATENQRAFARTVFLNAGKKNQLTDRDDINTLLEMTRNVAIEMRQRADDAADKNVRNLFRTLQERQAALRGGIDRASKAIARSMLEAEEIREGEDFVRAVRILQDIPDAQPVNLGDITNGKILEAIRKIEERYPVFGEELAVRRAHNIIGSLEVAADTDANVRNDLRARWTPKIMDPSIRENELVKASVDTWNTSVYRDLIVEKAALLQRNRGAYGGSPGDGVRFFENLEQQARSDPAKFAAIHAARVAAGI